VRRRQHLDHRVRAGLLTLVLLHGLGTGPGAWKPQLDALGGRDVVALDLVPAYRRGFEAAVDEVAGLVSSGDELCGLSLGGLIALHVAGRKQIGRLIVCAAFDRLPASLRRRTRALALAARVMPRGFLHRQLVAELPEAYRSQALGEIAPLRSAELARLMWQAAASVVDPTEITMPAVVACGERDRANLPLARTLAQKLPNARLELIPGAGHVANLDNPAAFTRLT
jgi:pimeloyl-ACP methyl ester carboxylesterase